MTRVPAALWIAVGAVLVLDALVVLVAVRAHSGVVATFVLGVLLVFYGFHPGPPRWVRVGVPLLSALLLVLTVTVAALGRMDTASQREDAVVVLGTALQGGEVTPALRSRLDVALYHATANPDALIVVAGGLGPGETVTEAFAMERYLVSHGVAGNRILREDRSTSTSENFAFAKSALDAHFDTDYTTAFVTSDYHVPRAAGIAERAGMRSTHAHADTPWYQVPVDHVRELMAMTKFLVTGR